MPINAGSGRRQGCRPTVRGFQRIPLGVDSGELGSDTGLVADVQLEQDGGERLDRHGVGELTGVERAASTNISIAAVGGALRSI